MPALEVKNVTKFYGGFAALNGVNLQVEAGEIRALIGPNGAGKSTLIDVISGRARKWTGQVHLFDRNISQLRASQRRLIGLSRSFQRTSIFPNLTVRAQLRLAAQRVGGGDADSLLEEFGLATLADSTGGAIAYGDQRRLDLALALIGRPSVLLLDEPAAGLTFEEFEASGAASAEPGAALERHRTAGGARHGGRLLHCRQDHRPAIGRGPGRGLCR